MANHLAATAAFAGLGILGVFFVWTIARYGLMFFREARGARKLSTLAGAAAVIAIIVNIVVGTLTQPAPSLTAPPPPKASVHRVDGVQAPHLP